MKTIRFKKIAALAAMALLCCSTILGSNVARAQNCDCSSFAQPCPPPPIDDIQYDTTPIPWQQGGSICAYIAVDTFGDSCCVSFCYVYRNTTTIYGTNYDYAVTSFNVDPNCNYNPSDSTVLKSASWWLMENNPQHFPTDKCPCSGGCSTCHGTNIQWNEYFIKCWAQCGKFSWEYCPQHGWCDDAYWACKDLSTGVIKLCYYRSVDSPANCNNSIPCGYGQCQQVFPDQGCPTTMGQ